jgi:beta-lactamase regulating signal transducer with metallopeptidase domain
MDVPSGSCGLKGRADCLSPGASALSENATAELGAFERRSGSDGRRETRASAVPASAGTSSWRLGLLILWLAGLGLELGLLAWGLWRSGRVIRRAAPVSEPSLLDLFGRLVNRLGLRREPGLRLSAEVRTPQALGSLRPQVLLPLRRLGALTPAEVEMTLCHELVHVRRGDLWLAWVPALAQRLFFFFPPAAWAAREYLVAREAACDAEVLRVLGSAPQAYGRLLLQWGVAPRETGLAAAGASPTLVNLKRRLQMLHETTEISRRSRLRWGLAGAVALVALIPFTIVAQSPAPEPPDAPAAAEAPGEPAPPDAEAPVAPGEPAPKIGRAHV